MGAVLGDEERRRRRQIEHLARDMVLRHARVQRLAKVLRRAAARANFREMIDDGIGMVGLEQGMALVALLPAGFFPDFSRRLDTRGGFFSPSLEGGLPLLEDGLPLLDEFSRKRRSSPASRAFKGVFGHKRGNLSRLRSNQRNQLFP